MVCECNNMKHLLLTGRVGERLFQIIRSVEPDFLRIDRSILVSGHVPSHPPLPWS